MPSVTALSALSDYSGQLLVGLWRTVLIAVLSYALGVATGLLLGIVCSAGKAVTRMCIKTYTGLFRALPELILILLLYYASSDALAFVVSHLGLNETALNGTQVAIIVLALVTAAYATEIFRAAIEAVPAGLIEAGHSLGMTRAACLRRITFPAMLPMALPGLSNLWLMVVKGTSLVSIVGVTELALAAEQGASATKAYFTIYFSALILYLILALGSLRLFNLIETRIRRGLVMP